MEKRKNGRPKSVADFLRLLNNHQAAEKRIREIRNGFSVEAIESISIRQEELIPQGMFMLLQCLEKLGSYRGAFPANEEAGHGRGHMIRDFYHAVQFALSCEIDPRHALVGLVAGTLHDIGCIFVPRYDEANRVIRHAEAGALYADYMLGSSDVALPISYAIAAHTHYMRSQAVILNDGAKRTIEPYQDMDGKNPIMGIWMTRWCDRLDCNGPGHVGRHLLTLSEDHEDFGEQTFYQITFSEHLRPILRSKEEIAAAGGKMTMLEHLKMFADSNSNSSPYGKHDFGKMVSLRDSYRQKTERIIDAVLNPKPVRSVSDSVAVISRWLERIEPTPCGRKATSQIMAQLKRHNPDIRDAWLHGLGVAATEYAEWSNEARQNFQQASSLVCMGLPFMGRLEDVLVP